LARGLSEGVCLVLLLVIPSFFNLGVNRVFEEEKALLLRSAALLLGGLALAGARWPRAIWSHSVVVSFGVLSAAFLVATLTGLSPYDSWWGVYYRRHGLATWLAFMVVFGALVAAARSPTGRDRLLTATIVGSLFPSLYAVAQWLELDPVTWTTAIPGRSGGTAGNALLMGGYLCVVLPATAAEWLRTAWAPSDARSPLHARALLLALALQVAGLLATVSRGPVAAAASGIAAGGLALVIRRPRWLAAVAVALAVIGGSVIATTGLASRFFEGGSGRVRWLIWQGVVESVTEDRAHLWLGFGPDSLRLVSPSHYLPEIAELEGSDAMPDRAHNETLDTLVSAGVVGVAAQWAVFAAVLACAAGVADPFRRAAVLGAVVSHVAEIHLGIATTMSRLVFLAVVALAVGESVGAGREASAPVRRPWAPGALVAVGLGSGVVSLLNPGTLSLYAFVLVSVFLLTRLLVAPRAPRREQAACAVVAALAAAVAWAVVLLPSRADRHARAGREMERRQDWSAAVNAYRSALALQPREPEYLTSLGRAFLEMAERADVTRRTDLYLAGEAPLRAALVRNPYDPHHPRNLANAARRRAATTQDAGARSALLGEADRLFARATAAAPGMAPLWVDWGNVALALGSFDSALQRLDRAAALDAEDVDQWVLRGLVQVRQRRLDDALAAYDRALALRPDQVAALRGRAVVLGTLGRTSDAVAATDRLLQYYPSDDLGQRLRASLTAEGPSATGP